MNAEAWAQIVAAYEDAGSILTRAFAERHGGPDLPALRERLRRRLLELGDALTRLGFGGVEIEAILRPLIFLFDEQVQERRVSAGATPDQLAWLPLQSDLAGVDGNGGELFYRDVDALLQASAPSALLLGVHLFCLEAGFEGELIDEPRKIPLVKQEIAGRLTQLEKGSLPSAGQDAAATPPKTRSAALYVLAAAGAVAAWHLILLAVFHAL